MRAAYLSESWSGMHAMIGSNKRTDDGELLLLMLLLLSSAVGTTSCLQDSPQLEPRWDEDRQRRGSEGVV